MPENELNQSTCDGCANKSSACQTSCADGCSSTPPPPHQKQPGETDEEYQTRLALEQNLRRIRHKILVLSGKGGVGKSTVAVNLATALSLAGKSVGLLDIDIHGPSVPRMLNLEGQSISAGADGLQPCEIGDMKVMSIGLLLKNIDDAVIWRGPMKMGVIQQFLKDVDWGPLDFLVIDSPPGTGDEPLSICQLIPDADGAVIVTTPQAVALNDVRKSIAFCRQLHMPVLGLIENMSGFVCPHCNQSTDIFSSGAAEDLARQTQTPFLGRIPIDPDIVRACDSGRPYVHHFADSATARIFAQVIEPLLALDDQHSTPLGKD